MTYAIAVAMPEPLTHYAGLGIKPTPLQWPEPLQSDSEPTAPQAVSRSNRSVWGSGVQKLRDGANCRHHGDFVWGTKMTRFGLGAAGKAL